MTQLIRYGDVSLQRYEADRALVDDWKVFSQPQDCIDHFVDNAGTELGAAWGLPEQNPLWKEFLLFGMLDASTNAIHDCFVRETYTAGKNHRATGKYNENGGIIAVGDWDGVLYIRPNPRIGVYDFSHVLENAGYKQDMYSIPRQGISERYQDDCMERVFQFLGMVERQAEDQGIERPTHRDPSLPRIIFPGLFMIPGRRESGEIIIR